MKYCKRTVHELHTEDGTVEIEHEPYGDPLAERVGKFLVVGYLVHDDNAEDPMTACDGQGEIVEGVAAHKHLGLDSYGDIDIDKNFELNGEMVSLRELAERFYEDFNGTIKISQDAIEEYAYNLYGKHWQDIAGPFVVPVSHYGYENYRVKDWDGNVFRMPQYLWVADDCAKDNINGQSQDKPLQERVHRYVQAILDEYSEWAQGHNYGVVIEVFEDGEPVSEDSCWGYTGLDNAEAELKGVFKTEVSFRAKQ